MAEAKESVAGPGQLSAHALETFVGPGVSALREDRTIDVGELQAAASSWISGFLLNVTFRVNVPEPQRQVMLNFLRRTDSALDEYTLGREELVRYLERLGIATSHYFHALRHFEASIEGADRAYELLRRLANGAKLFEKNDRSMLDRLRTIYNHSKHAEGHLPEGRQLSMWLTNDGFECGVTQLSHAEFGGLLHELVGVAGHISNLAPAQASPTKEEQGQ